MIHVFLFQVFNATDNLKAARFPHLFLGLNENFFEKTLFLRKYSTTNFSCNGSAGMNFVLQVQPSASKSYVKD